jgi:hypothetical protein
MYSFCLLYREDDVCYGRGTCRKPAWQEPESSEWYINWLNMKAKSMSKKAAMNVKEDAKDSEHDHRVQQQEVEDS